MTDFSTSEKITAFLADQDKISSWGDYALLYVVAKDQLPEDFVSPSAYARLILTDKVDGYVLLTEYARGKVHYGTFAFCLHAHTSTKNLGRCYNRYDCQDCGLSWAIDSSD